MGEHDEWLTALHVFHSEGAYRHDIHVPNGALAEATAKLIAAIWAQKHDTISPITFRESFYHFAPQFKGEEQHDAEEFLGFLLDGLNKDLNLIKKSPGPVKMTEGREKNLERLPRSQSEWDICKRSNDSFIVRCFHGQYEDQLRCAGCLQVRFTLLLRVRGF